MSNPMTPEEIIAAVDAHEQAGATKGGPVLQTRRIVKALQLIGVERSDFSARVERLLRRDRSTGKRYAEYGDALGSIRSHAGQQRVIDNAETLNRCGISVHIVEGNGYRTTAFVSSSYPYRTVRYNTDTNALTVEREVKR